MAQTIENSPLLSLCIPIYNRIVFLERQLERFLEDKDLFDGRIQLIIADNCSADDLQSCCEKYQNAGLNLHYHRQETNIGPDGNFEWCFHYAKGKYVWLLGSDDILVKGFLRKLVGYLDNADYGLLHLSMRKMPQELTVFETSDEMAVAVNYWITFMSSNIIRTESLKTVDFSEYKNSFLIQVPAYLNACCSYMKNAIVYQERFFEKETDFANNGGYNLFQVFVGNLYGIYESFIANGLLSKKAFRKIKKDEYRYFLLPFIFTLLIRRQKRNFKTEGAWRLLRKYYGRDPYAYFYLMKEFVRRFLRKINP